MESSNGEENGLNKKLFRRCVIFELIRGVLTFLVSLSFIDEGSAMECCSS